MRLVYIYTLLVQLISFGLLCAVDRLGCSYSRCRGAIIVVDGAGGPILIMYIAGDIGGALLYHNDSNYSTTF